MLVPQALEYARRYLFDNYLVPELRGSETVEQFVLNPGLRRHLTNSLERLVREFNSVSTQDVALLLECFVLAHVLTGSISMLNHVSRELKREGELRVEA